MAEEEFGKIALTAANSELYAATQKLDAVVRASPHAIITHDLHGRVGHLEPGGLPPYLGPDAPEEFQHLTRRVVAGETLHGVGIVHRRKDGGAIELSLSAAALLDPPRRRPCRNSPVRAVNGPPPGPLPAGSLPVGCQQPWL